MSALSKGSAIGDIDAWTWTAMCFYCVLHRRQVLYHIAVEIRPGTRTQEEDGGEWVPGHNRPSSRRIDLYLFDCNGIHIDIRRSDAGSDGRTGAVLPSLAPTHICTRPALLCGPFWLRTFSKGDSGFWVPILANPTSSSITPRMSLICSTRSCSSLVRTGT
ncbi:hypothetical protein K438DRAFT_1977990 [Mycena galopus ATCC 62051]|nr:hypothetical protein K438DRAFT_1977990 [Mycena galopus ATCC 62051]